jgi:uncharacterized protein
MEYTTAILASCFFIIALIYSSVGFGGGSSYLALLAQPVFLLLPEEIRPIALCCNIIVVTSGSIIFYKEGKIVWKDVWPFLVFSVPMSYLGGFWKLGDHAFFIILGITLIQCLVFKEHRIEKEEGHNQKNGNGNTVWKDVFREIYFFHAAKIGIRRKIGRIR